jgi:osmotically-inducible protein OsmY
MAYKHGKIAAILLLSWMLGGCQAITGRTVGQNIDDSNTTAAVKTQLARDKASSLTRIDVDTNAGVVSLNGTVETAEERALRRSRAALAASSVSSTICRSSAKPAHRG